MTGCLLAGLALLPLGCEVGTAGNDESLTDAESELELRRGSNCADHRDNDGDGYCDVATGASYCLDGAKPGDSECMSKNDAERSPSACRPGAEVCDGKDNDCDGVADEGGVCCVPAVCGADDCGAVEDGCGRTLDCGPCAEPCGDGTCAAGETCATCEADCGKCLGAITAFYGLNSQGVCADDTTVVGGSLQLSAKIVTDSATIVDSDGTYVTWTMDPSTQSGGGTISPSGLYTAPATIPTFADPVHPHAAYVWVTAKSDPTKKDYFFITITSSSTVAVSVSPASATLKGGQTLQLTASVTGTSDTAVSWSVREGTAGGSVTATGLYTAPSSAGLYHVVATSHADASRSASAAIEVATAPPPGVVPAFPEAQGGGAATRGGRGGVVHEVTNLNDSGPGSLRACVEASGPRTCVFRVAGVIRLLRTMYVNSGYLTVAGQTAPGGIAIYTGAVTAIAAFSIDAPHVVLRYLRIWGDTNPDDPNHVDYGRNFGLQTWGRGSDLIVDHCSMLWQTSFNMASGGPRHTYSWNLMAEVLMYSWSPQNGQSVAVLVADPLCTYNPGAGGQSYTTPIEDVDFHHNLLASTNHRMPALSVASGRVINNAIYNWERASYVDAGGSTGTIAKVDFVGNHYKPGRWGKATPYTEIMANRSDNGGGQPFVSLYVSGNKSEWANNGRGAVAASDSDQAQWAKLVSGSRIYQGPSDWWPLRGWGASSGYARSPYQRLPAPASGIDITAESADTLAASLTAAGGVGASRRLDCEGRWVTLRDSAEQRIFMDYLNGTGPSYPLGSVAEANGGGLPALTSGTACTDGDHDGMPDAWESAHGLNPSSASDGPALAPDGYSNLEHYLNGQ